MASRPPHSSGSGIDLTTLLITAVASAAAAYGTSKIWAPGTLASAAFTPVIVAIIKEGLAKPAKVVTQAVPIRGVVRSAPGPSGTAAHPSLPVVPEITAAELERVSQQGEIHYHSTPASARARRWRLAIVTGLLGFVVAALAFTVPELVAGSKTTYFGGQGGGRAAPTQTTTVPGRTVTQPPAVTVTQPPAVTVTAPPVEPTPVPAPAVTTPPAATTTTPAPAVPGVAPAPVPVQP